MKKILSSVAILALLGMPVAAQAPVDPNLGAGAGAGVDAGAGAGGDQTGADVNVDADADVNAGADAAQSDSSGDPGLPAVGTVQLADLVPDQLIGADIYDAEENHVATVSDVVTAPDGTPTQVVASVGGFLGIGARTIAIDLAAAEFEVAGEGDLRIHVPMTAAEIEALPPQG